MRTLTPHVIPASVFVLEVFGPDIPCLYPIPQAPPPSSAFEVAAYKQRRAERAKIMCNEDIKCHAPFLNLNHAEITRGGELFTTYSSRLRKNEIIKM